MNPDTFQILLEIARLHDTIIFSTSFLIVMLGVVGILTGWSKYDTRSK